MKRPEILFATAALAAGLALGLAMPAPAKWSAAKRSESQVLRYQMHVTPAGEIVRLDRVTGQLHVVSGRGIHDLPETAAAAAPIEFQAER